MIGTQLLCCERNKTLHGVLLLSYCDTFNFVRKIMGEVVLFYFKLRLCYLHPYPHHQPKLSFRFNS